MNLNEHNFKGEYNFELTVPDIKKEAVKFDNQKNQLELLPIVAIEEIGKVLTYGAEKYEPNNWRKGFRYSRLFGATLRHLFSWWKGEDIDPESNISHLAHAACNILFLIEYKDKELDDRKENQQ